MDGECKLVVTFSMAGRMIIKHIASGIHELLSIWGSAL